MFNMNKIVFNVKFYLFIDLIHCVHIVYNFFNLLFLKRLLKFKKAHHKYTCGIEN